MLSHIKATVVNEMSWYIIKKGYKRYWLTVVNIIWNMVLKIFVYTKINYNNII